MTIQMKAIEQYFPVALFNKLYKVVLTFEYVYDIVIMLYQVVLTFTFVDEILKCDHSNKSY